MAIWVIYNDGTGSKLSTTVRDRDEFALPGRVMEGVRQFLEAIRQNQLAKGHFRGLLHIVIGRKISLTDGTILSTGLTWRQTAELLRNIRWDKELVREFDLNPDDLPPRDRQRYWYSAIAAGKIDSLEARADAAVLAALVLPLGYVIS